MGTGIYFPRSKAARMWSIPSFPHTFATAWTIGVLRFDSRRGVGIFLFTTQTRSQWVPGALSLGVKRSGREVDHSPPSSAQVKEWVELYLHSSNTLSWRGAQLKHRDKFTFTPIRFHGVVLKKHRDFTRLPSMCWVYIARASNFSLQPTVPILQSCFNMPTMLTILTIVFVLH
jgi:hypothetical protein